MGASSTQTLLVPGTQPYTDALTWPRHWHAGSVSIISWIWARVKSKGPEIFLEVGCSLIMKVKGDGDKEGTLGI